MFNKSEMYDILHFNNWNTWSTLHMLPWYHYSMVGDQENSESSKGWVGIFLCANTKLMCNFFKVYEKLWLMSLSSFSLRCTFPHPPPPPTRLIYSQWDPCGHMGTLWLSTTSQRSFSTRMWHIRLTYLF